MGEEKASIALFEYFSHGVAEARRSNSRDPRMIRVIPVFIKASPNEQIPNLEPGKAKIGQELLGMGRTEFQPRPQSPSFSVPPCPRESHAFVPPLQRRKSKTEPPPFQDSPVKFLFAFRIGSAGASPSHLALGETALRRASHRGTETRRKSGKYDMGMHPGLGNEII